MFHRAFQDQVIVIALPFYLSKQQAWRRTYISPGCWSKFGSSGSPSGFLPPSRLLRLGRTPLSHSRKSGERPHVCERMQRLHAFPNLNPLVTLCKCGMSFTLLFLPCWPQPCTISWLDSCSLPLGLPMQCHRWQICQARTNKVEFFKNEVPFWGLEVCLRQRRIDTWMMDFVRGSVMTFSRSGASSPLSRLKESMMSCVSFNRTPVAASNGRRMSTDSQLKKSCTVAPAKALKQQRQTREPVTNPGCFLLYLLWFTCGTHSYRQPASWPRWCWWQTCRCWLPWWLALQTSHPTLQQKRRWLKAASGWRYSLKLQSHAHTDGWGS